MFPLFESLCVLDGNILHTEWHQLRFQQAYSTLFGKPPTFNLVDGIQVPKKFSQGKVKLKISYDAAHKEHYFQHYKMQNVQQIQLVAVENLDYTYKYSKRENLELLFAQRGHCDDVLIVRNGWITDSSYANVVFYDGAHWWTPAAPLLAGTCRARLLSKGVIREKPIHVKDLKLFNGLKLINALRDFDQPTIPITSLLD